MKLLATITDKEVFGKEIEFNGKCSLRAAARAIVLDKNKNIAILHAKNYGFHKLPGGGIEKGENKEKALERELKEEIGCRVGIVKELGKIIEIKKECGQRQTSYCYVAKISDRCDSNLTEEEKNNLGIKVIWVKLDKAIRIFEEDKPEEYTAKFIRCRDLIFLKEFSKFRVELERFIRK